MGLTFGGVIYSDDQTFELPNDKSGTIALTSDINGGGKVYRALLSQSGTDAPTATVLENSLGGTVVWTRSDVGDYQGTLSGAFTENKTFIDGKLISVSPDDSAISIVETQYSTSDAVQLNSTYTELSPISVVRSDGFTNLPVKILVYP